MLRVKFIQQIIVVSTLFCIPLFLGNCNREQSERPRSARDAADVLNRLDVTDTKSIELANVYLTRYLSTLTSASQDSAWMAYESFVNRFVESQAATISPHLMVQGGGPFKDEGIVGALANDTWRLNVDHVWRYDQYAHRADSSLHVWLRIQQYRQAGNQQELFGRIHRLEFWADHFPASPMLGTMQIEYRESIRRLLESLPEEFDPKNADFVELFHLMHLYAGLDATKIITKYISSLQNDENSLNASAITDTLRYRPRPWIFAEE
jgi:hypothetical protein